MAQWVRTCRLDIRGVLTIRLGGQSNYLLLVEKKRDLRSYGDGAFTALVGDVHEEEVGAYLDLITDDAAEKFLVSNPALHP